MVTILSLQPPTSTSIGFPQLIRLAEVVVWDVPEGPVRDQAIGLFQWLCLYADSVPITCDACRDTGISTIAIAGRRITLPCRCDAGVAITVQLAHSMAEDEVIDRQVEAQMAIDDAAGHHRLHWDLPNNECQTIEDLLF